MTEEYKQAAFELFEELLIKYNLYSQFTIQVFDLFKETLQEFFNNCFSSNSGNIDNFFSNCEYRIYSEWYNSLIKLKEKYKIYSI